MMLTAMRSKWHMRMSEKREMPRRGESGKVKKCIFQGSHFHFSCSLLCFVCCYFHFLFYFFAGGVCVFVCAHV